MKLYLIFLKSTFILYDIFIGHFILRSNSHY